MQKKINVLFLLVLFQVLQQNLLEAQTLEDSVFVGQPYDYRIPTGELVEANKVGRAFSPWEVYSDRFDNKTYDEPNGNQVVKDLEFMESFYVAEEKGEFLRLAKDPKIREKTFSKEAEDYGWIHRNKLLLWNRCLVTKVGKIYRKAFVPIKDFFYNAPQADSENYKPFGEGQFFYILKKENSFYLLGSIDHLDIDYGNDFRLQRANSLVRWIHEDKVILWNSRVCVEPNYQSYQERESKSRKVRFFMDESTAKKYAELSEEVKINWANCNKKAFPCNRIVWDKDETEKRWEGDKFRLPVLEVNEDIFKTLVIIPFHFGEQTIYFSKEAYSSFEFSGLDSPPFLKVLLLSRNELSELLASLERLSTSGSDFGTRKEFQNEWKMLLKTFDDSLTEPVMEKMNMKDIQEKVFGLPGASANMLAKYKLGDITDEKKLPSSEMQEYVNRIKNKTKVLNDIFNTVGEYEYGFISSNQQYYWIKEDLLP